MRKSGRWWWEAGRLNTDVHGWHGFSALFRELFFFVVVLFVVMLESFPDEFCCRRVGDFVDGSRFGEVEPFGGGFDGADGVDGVGFGAKVASVVAGEVEAVEQGGGSFGVELAGGESVDDDGEGDLDGFAVFEGGELDMLARDEVAAGGRGGAKGGVALMEAVVEVAPESSGECSAFALQAGGLDMAAEFVLHGCSCFRGGGPCPLPGD